MSPSVFVERHPPVWRARLVRALRGLKSLRGWERVVNVLAPQNDATTPFTVANRGGIFAGDLSSFIDRRMYLFGGYEEDLIREFLSRIPTGRRGVILDVGANVGTHSLAFAQHFGQVHAFEPNPSLWSAFETNVRLNNLNTVQLHKVGLADREGELPFYLIEKNNFGLGTCSDVEQYDLPLKKIGTVRVEIGDSYLEAAGIQRVDAIKIDVQGFEAEVIRGLAKTLARDRPFVWLEVSESIAGAPNSYLALKSVFPYENTLLHFQPWRSGAFNTVRLQPARTEGLQPGDYLIVPDIAPVAR